MQRRSWMPMRTTVGDPLPIVKEAVEVKGTFANKVSVVSQNTFDQIDLPYDQLTLSTLDLTTSTTTYQRGGGVASFSNPIDSPFEAPFSELQIPFVTIYGSGDAVSENISRELWFELEIDIKVSIQKYNEIYRGKNDPIETIPAIGGICFGGYPYIPYYVSEEGENSANYGLPREVRVSWKSEAEDTFLDAENALTSQKPTTHSGTHILSVGPVKTEKLTIRFSDVPRFLSRVPRGGELVEIWGCAIPYLMLFSYRERMRYEPHVPAGLLAAIHSPPKRERSYTSVINPSPDTFSAEAVEATCADFIYTTGVPLQYYPLSAASILGRPRGYNNDLNGGEELFWSQDMEEGNHLRFYIEQVDENLRCLSGMRLDFGKSQPQNFSAFELKVYESDPISGVSPINISPSIDEDKYATLIYRDNIDQWQPKIDCTFIRPTASKYLIAEFTLLDNTGRLMVNRLALLQSAHLSLAPRKSKSRQVESLHFRLIGENLAGDYAQLGENAFSFAVEYVVSNEPRSTLFEAHSLFDLARQNNVRVIANQRYLETTRDVSHEVAITHPDSYELRRTEAKSTGWQRSTSGKNTAWQDDASRKLNQSPGNNNPFTTEQSSETRMRAEHLGFQSIVSQVRDYVVAYGSWLSNDPDWANSVEAKRALDSIFPEDPNITDLRTGWDELWKCLADNPDTILKVDGLTNYSLPPYLFFEEYVEKHVKFLQSVTNLNPTTISLADIQSLATSNPILGPFLAIQGLSFGLNAGVNGSESISGGIGLTNSKSFGMSGGASISTSPQLPTTVRTSAEGTTGTITHQASKQGCSYSQHLNNGYDDAETFVRYLDTDPKSETGIAARMDRTVDRELFQPGTIRERESGVNVFWQGRAQDIITGTIPLNVQLPATADKIYRTADQSIRVRFPSGINDIHVDVWFDIREEAIRDDY